MAKLNYEKAKKAGYSDEEIVGFLSEKTPKFNLKKAKESGYSSEEIIKFLSELPEGKSQEPASLKGAATAYASGAAGGAGGIIPDVAKLLEPLAAVSPGVGALTNLMKQSGAKTTPELTESVGESLGSEGPKNALERILQSSGEFGGQEAVIGTSLGGPAAGGLGLAHGSASGALYGGLKELGMDDTWALGITMVASLSPIAAQKLITKFKSGSSLKSALNAVKKEVPEAATAIKAAENEIPKAPGGEPPSPPGGAFPFVGKQVSAGSRGFELGEEALSELEKPTIERPKASIEFPKVTKAEAPSLKGRITTEPEQKVLEKQEGFGIKVPVSEETKPLTGRAKIVEHEIGSVISPEKFKNDKHGGVNLSAGVKTLSKEEKIPVTKAYREAEQVYKGQNDIFPELAHELDESINRLNESSKLNTGEKSVLDQLTSLRNLLGDSSGFMEVPLSRLIRTSDSMSGIANYEMPFTGPKEILKRFTKLINESVMRSLETKGLNANAMRKADSMYGSWARKFLNDEISPFLERRILNPESIFKKAISDQGTYRALRHALGTKRSKSMQKLERSISENRMGKYLRDPNKVGSKEFMEDMNNLEGLIGKEKSVKIKNALEKEKRFPRPSVTKEHKAKRTLHPERITSATQLKAAKPSKVPTPKPIAELSSKGKMTPERVTSATQNKASEYLGKDPEHIDKLMNSRSGMRKLKEDLSKVGKKDLFDSLAQEKTLDILRGGYVGPEKITGLQVWENIRNPKNYEILSEIYGKEAVNAALLDAYEAKKSKLITDKLIRLGKLGVTIAGAGKLIKVFSILL